MLIAVYTYIKLIYFVVAFLIASLSPSQGFTYSWVMCHKLDFANRAVAKKCIYIEETVRRYTTLCQDSWQTSELLVDYCNHQVEPICKVLILQVLMLGILKPSVHFLIIHYVHKWIWPSYVSFLKQVLCPPDPQIPQFYWCLVRRAVAICFGKTRTPGKHFSGEGLLLTTKLL